MEKAKFKILTKLFLPHIVLSVSKIRELHELLQRYEKRVASRKEEVVKIYQSCFV
jgi:hypothetical protein